VENAFRVLAEKLRFQFEPQKINAAIGTIPHFVV
jgi:hypothetical protein